jgi:L-ascorbate metabolism protein UlaG (beta-lactamase superfamily)
VREIAEERPLEEVLAAGPTPGPGAEKNAPSGAELWWLGQAGFLVKAGGRTLLVDPYLSDFLVRKYKGKLFPHVRMMPSPLAPSRARGVDLVLCTHRHSDHMDPETLPEVAALNPACVFLVPRAVRWRALEIGLPEERVLGIADGESLSPVEGVEVEAVHAAHEQRVRNDRGEDEFLGYVIRAGGACLYHSGDSVPHEGLVERLSGRGIDLALLPINGRDDYRRSNGIPGNFTFEEAVRLCEEARIPALLCHHFGMFDFNTADVGQARARLQGMSTEVRVSFAATGIGWRISA